MVVGFTTTYAISAYHHWCCECESRSGRGVQHYVIEFVSDLRQVGGFPYNPNPINCGVIKLIVCASLLSYVKRSWNCSLIWVKCRYWHRPGWTIELNIELILKKNNSSVSIYKEAFKNISVSLMNKIFWAKKNIKNNDFVLLFFIFYFFVCLFAFFFLLHLLSIIVKVF
jgi:hypothetical protein